ncbi:hypothetical protein EDC01DRAFT_637477 [Geopyxis carbonaria]|nr:hypothetical protein EDC01DRAFT_637477 [Geopyxis carbonaria]
MPTAFRAHAVEWRLAMAMAMMMMMETARPAGVLCISLRRDPCARPVSGSQHAGVRDSKPATCFPSRQQCMLFHHLLSNNLSLR